MATVRTKQDIDHCWEVANEAYKQLFWSIDMMTFLSWGVSKKCYAFYHNMPTLILRVSGMVHKGWVYVSLDEASDAYIVTLLNIRREVKKTMSDIYCDSLGSVIDELVEKPADMNDKEYHQKAIRDSQEKFNRV